MKRTIKSVCAIVVAGTMGMTSALPAVACSGTSTQSAAAGQHKHNGLRGKIRSVSATSITIQTGGKSKGHEVTLTFAANPKITLNGSASSVSALSQGDEVEIKDNKGIAEAVHARTPGTGTASAHAHARPNA